MTCWSKRWLVWIKYTAGQCLHISPPQTHPSTPKPWATAALPPCTASLNFLLLFLTLFSAKSKNLLFHGEQSILICLKPVFHFEFSFLLLMYTQAHIFICKHDIKDTYSGKQRSVSHCLNMPPFWRVLLPEEKFTEFPLVWLNSFKCCASRQTENLAYPQVPPSVPHLTGRCCDHKKDGNRC